MPAKDVDAQIDQHLEKGYGALERNDAATARRAAQAALALDADVADAHALLGAIAEREGDLEAAGAAYAAAHAADPEAFEPLLALAEIEHARGDVARARKLFAEAVDVAEEEDEYVEALLSSAELELAEGDAERAGAVLVELPEVELPEPNDHLRAGDILRQVAAFGGAGAKETLASAERHFTAALARAEGDDALIADATYGLALIDEAREAREAMIRRFGEVLALDAKEARAPWSVPDDRMEEIVEAALEELPERARVLLANVPIVIEPRPGRAQVQEGLDPRLLGLFSGPSLPDGGDMPSLQQITLYARNLERAASSVEDLEEEIRITLLHETGHFFGMDEDALAELELD